MPIDPISAGASAINAGVNVARFFSANAAQKRNERELANLKQPFYKIQNEYLQNMDLAANQATTGLPDSTKNYLTTEAQRGMGTGIGALNQVGGNPNDVNRLFSTFENSIDKTAAQDAQARIANIQNFMNVNKELAGQKNMAWTLNEYRPYENKLKQLTNNIAAEKQNKNNAINGAIGSVSAFATGQQNADLMKNLFGGSGQTGTPSDMQRVAFGDGSSTATFNPNSVSQDLRNVYNGNNPAIQPISNINPVNQEPFSLSNNQYGE